MRYGKHSRGRVMVLDTEQLRAYRVICPDGGPIPPNELLDVWFPRFDADGTLQRTPAAQPRPAGASFSAQLEVMQDNIAANRDELAAQWQAERDKGAEIARRRFCRNE